MSSLNLLIIAVLAASALALTWVAPAPIASPGAAPCGSRAMGRDAGSPLTGYGYPRASEGGRWRFRGGAGEAAARLRSG